MTKRILMLGVPAGLQNAIFAIANLFIQAGVNSFDSLMVKGNSAAANADAMVYDAMAAFYMACASRGLGKTVGPTVIVILGSCVFRVAWVYTIFAHFHTIPALYLLYPCSWALTAAAEIVYFVFSYRRAALRLRERDALAQL